MSSPLTYKYNSDELSFDLKYNSDELSFDL